MICANRERRALLVSSSSLTRTRHFFLGFEWTRATVLITAIRIASTNCEYQLPGRAVVLGADFTKAGVNSVAIEAPLFKVYVYSRNLSSSKRRDNTFSRECTIANIQHNIDCLIFNDKDCISRASAMTKTSEKLSDRRKHSRHVTKVAIEEINRDGRRGVRDSRTASLFASRCTILENA